MERIVYCLWVVLCVITAITRVTVTDKTCNPQFFDQSSFVCVCNATYCDEVEANVPLPRGRYAVYASSQEMYRLTKFEYLFNQESTATDDSLVIDRTVTYQTILGFGGAFTDAAGINIASLSEKTAENLIRTYFGHAGAEYTIGRIPMASCDFSTRVYSYDDVPGDTDLKHFTLAEEDLKYKIKYIKAAESVSRRPITLFASPWSSPGWMKNSGKMQGNGTLLGKPGGKFYKTWANYFVRFLQEYDKRNISLWGVTAQNEPTTGYFPNYPFQTLGFTADTQQDFVAEDLGPALEANGYGHVKIMVLDDQRVNLPSWAETVMKSPEASKYISGVAVHWYSDFIDPAFPLSETHDALPDKFILYTEACEGSFPWSGGHVLLGSWDRFETYAKNIMDDLANWVVGWTDWNLALDLEGGPNWVKNFVDSPIIVDKKADVFYKQPMYYALGHFSKFLPKGCVRIDLKAGKNITVKSTLSILAFTCPDKSTVVQISNRASSSQSFKINDPLRGTASVTILAHAHNTLVWW